jgi:penicillin-insensitive murein endopeptidase
MRSVAMRASPLVLAFAIAASAIGCMHAPSPLVPGFRGSIGTVSRGVLTEGEMLPAEGVGYHWLRHDDRHYAIPRFARAIERAAAKVATERPGSTLAIGDISARHGGQLNGHMSHRAGRDVDLLLYLTTLDGAPIESPGFIRIGADGLGWDEAHQRWVRFDVEREWLLVKALVEDEDARVQWLFANPILEGMLIEWARAKGEPAETIWRAENMLLRPAPPADPHDDHIHVRVACNDDDVAHGCEVDGPRWPWIHWRTRPAELTDADLALSLFQSPRVRVEASASNRR